MKKTFSALFQTHFRKKSLFYRILGWTILLSVIMLLFINFHVEQSTTEKYEEKTNGVHLSYLRQVSNTMNTSIFFLQSHMTQDLWEKEMIRYMINPETATADQEYTVVQNMKVLVENTSLLSRVCFYSPITKKVLLSDEKTVDYSSFEQQEIFEQQLGKQEKYRQDADIYSAVFHDGKDIFLIQEFFTNSHVGTLVYQLDAAAILENLGWGTEDEVYVLDEGGKLFLASYYDSIPPSLEDLKASGKLVESSDSGLGEDGDYYRYVDPETQWSYLQAVKPTTGQWDWQMILPILIPMGLLYLILSFLASFFISKQIYRPINRLLQIISGPSGETAPEQLGNEVDYLELAYTETVTNNQRLTELMHRIGGEVSEQLYRKILLGKEFSQQELQESFENIGRAEAVHEVYTVGVIQIQEKEDGLSQELSDSLCYNSLSQLVQECRFLTCSRTVLQMENHRVVLVMGFPEKTPAAKVKYQMNQMKVYLQKQMADISYPILYGQGGIYRYVGDIGYSYREAVEMVTYSHYLRDEQKLEETGMAEGVLSEEMEKEQYYAKRLSLTLREAVDGRRKSAQTQLEQLLREIRGEEVGVQHILIHVVVNTMIETLMNYHIEIPPMLEVEVGVNAKGQEDSRVEMERLYAQGMVVLEAIENRRRRNQTRYIEEARKYIEEHYSDSSLSVIEVSEHLHISSNYFSAMFNEQMKKTFSVYLNELRLNQAKYLLKNTNLVIKDIGFRCGFSTNQHFNRVFKKYESMTPGQYREQSRMN